MSQSETTEMKIHSRFLAIPVSFSQIDNCFWDCHLYLACSRDAISMLSARHAILTGQAVHLPFYILGLHGLDTEKRSMILPLCIETNAHLHQSVRDLWCCTWPNFSDSASYWTKTLQATVSWSISLTSRNSLWNKDGWQVEAKREWER